MSSKTIRIIKLGLTIVSAGLTFLSKSNSEKILDQKIANKVAEELSKRK